MRRVSPQYDKFVHDFSLRLPPSWRPAFIALVTERLSRTKAVTQLDLLLPRNTSSGGWNVAHEALQILRCPAPEPREGRPCVLPRARAEGELTHLDRVPARRGCQRNRRWATESTTD